MRIGAAVGGASPGVMDIAGPPRGRVRRELIDVVPRPGPRPPPRPGPRPDLRPGWRPSPYHRRHAPTFLEQSQQARRSMSRPRQTATRRDGAIAVVTGASSGIGRRLALELA